MNLHGIGHNLEPAGTARLPWSSIVAAGMPLTCLG